MKWYNIPMRITSLQTQTTDKERISIFVDDHFLLGVNALLVLQMGLKVGQTLTSEQLVQLRSEEALRQAVDRALNFLSFRPRSREEVRRYLRKKETPPELIDTVLERLDRLDFVNDRAFASFWIESREQFNPRGSNVLKQELRMKGVDREVVDELVSDEQDEERAMIAGRKKAASLLRLPDMDYKTFRTRLGSFLQRRGFGFSVTTHTVKALWEELSEDAIDDEDL
jgi:regulatory protein